ncbi:MAG: pilin [Patescibacteria group bacterium]
MKKLFIIFSLFGILSISQISIGAGTPGYQPLTPITGLTTLPVGTNPGSSGTGFSGYLKMLYTWGVAGASGLAVVMIMWGGVEYMTSAGGGGVEEAKKRIQSAITGLLLALGSYLILYTVNRDLLRLDFTLSQLAPIVVKSAGAQYYNGVDTSGTSDGGSFGPVSDRTGKNTNTAAEDAAAGEFLSHYTGDGTIGPEAIANAAEFAINNQVNTCYPGTNGGRRACAYAVNGIVQAATGKPAGGNLSTTDMYDALQTNSNYVLVDGGLGGSQRGDIVLSPTNSQATGHVGIVMQDGATSIASNSSNNAAVQYNYNATSWTNSYASKNGVYVYRYVGND